MRAVLRCPVPLLKRLVAERKELLDLHKKYERSEDDLKALQSVGQIIGEVLRQLTEDKCTCNVAPAMRIMTGESHMK